MSAEITQVNLFCNVLAVSVKRLESMLEIIESSYKDPSLWRALIVSGKTGQFLSDLQSISISPSPNLMWNSSEKARITWRSTDL